MQRTLLQCLLALLAAPASLYPLAPAVEPIPLQRFAFEEPHMGTLFRIVLYAPDEAAAKKAAKAAFTRVAELNRILSDYLPDSELMRLCKQAGGEAKPVSKDLFTVLQKAQELAKLSDGAFDVSVGPVVRLWRVARKTKQLPDGAAIKEALGRVDYRKIRLDADRQTVQLLLAAMLLDLGGIAKGYTADEVLAVLRRHGITRALVAAGGDITVAEPPPDAPGWKIAIAPLRSFQPDTAKEAPQYLSLKNAAVSTAGDANQFVEIGGTRYSHIVDPRTGMGLVGRRSVTVIAPTGILADGFDTAACVMGVEQGMKLVEGRGCEAQFVHENGADLVTTRSRGFERYLWKE